MTVERRSLRNSQTNVERARHIQKKAPAVANSKSIKYSCSVYSNKKPFEIKLKSRIRCCGNAPTDGDSPDDNLEVWSCKFAPEIPEVTNGTNLLE
jgi:hypothetical protein